MRWCEKKARGRVKMRVFAQRCNQCPEPPFATPEFTWDNISRILNNLLFRILKKCYKEGFKQMSEIPLLGDTSLEGPHDRGNCEACLLGFCAQNDLGQASKPPAPPLSSTSSKSTREPKVTATGSNISSSRSSSKVEKPQASKVNLQASNPTKDDPKVSCTSKQSTTPILTIQQLSVVSSPVPRCVIQMPSPAPVVDSSRAAGVANKNTRSKTPKSLRSSSLYVPPTSSNTPSTSSHAPLTSSYAQPASSHAPPTSPHALPASCKATPTSSHAPPTSPYAPPTSHKATPTSSHAPPTSPYALPASCKAMPTSSHAPPTSPYALPTSYKATPTSSYVPPTSPYVLPTSSSFAVPISSSWGSPASTSCQVERGSHIHPQSQSSCCQACCGACCKCCCESFQGCCESFGGCCEASRNCMSQSPLCCLVFLILFLFLWYLL